MDLNELTLGQLKEIGKLVNVGMSDNQDAHWEIGKNYFIRTVTHHFTGTLVSVTEHELVVENAAWIADDGSFSDAILSEEFNEVEPYPDGQLIIGRGSLIDAFEIKKTQRSKK